MKKILVAGGAGYMGHRLVPALIARNYDVTVVDPLWFMTYKLHGVRLLADSMMRLKWEDLKGYDATIFMAGMSSRPLCDACADQALSSNVAAPAYLAYLSKKAAVPRFIYASTVSVYGNTLNDVSREEDSIITQELYGMSKIMGEKASIYLADDTFSVIALRKGTLSGYSPRMRLDLIVNAMFKSALVKGEITVMRSPDLWRPILSVKDATHAYIQAIEAPKEVSGVFNIASGNYTIGEIAESIQNAVGGEIIVQGGDDDRNYKVSIEKSADVLSFRPEQKIDDIVKELIEFKHEFSDWSNPAYYNINAASVVKKEKI